MRAKFVNESLRLLTPEDCIKAICKKLEEKGEIGASIDPSNWKQQTKRGFGTYTSDFFNQKAGKTVTVEYTDDTILEIELEDDDNYSPFGSSSQKLDNTESKDWFDTYSQEREKERQKEELLNKKGIYSVEDEKKKKLNKATIYNPDELNFQIISDPSHTSNNIFIIIQPKNGTKLKKSFGINDLLFSNFFKMIDAGVFITNLSLTEAKKFLKKIGMIEKKSLKNNK